LLDTLAQVVSHGNRPAYGGPVTARGLGGVLLALVVGASVGVGVAYATRADPDATGTATPVPAESPSMPTDDPYAPDIPYPALAGVSTFDRYRIGNVIQTWSYAVPAGWVAFDVNSGESETPPDQVDSLSEVRFRPEGEPRVGGYSLRVKAITNHFSPADEVVNQIAEMRRATVELDVLKEYEDAVYFTFRTKEGRLRYNFFRWFAAPGFSQATLEASISGRAVDEEGMRALFDQFTERVRPVED
jgi:hypothetical protein